MNFCMFERKAKRRFAFSLSLCLRIISVKGLDKLPRDQYEVASEIGTPDALLLRSHVLSKKDLSDSIKAIARAGAGVNNIPIADCTEKGIHAAYLGSAQPDKGLEDRVLLPDSAESVIFVTPE